MQGEVGVLVAVPGVAFKFQMSRCSRAIPPFIPHFSRGWGGGKGSHHHQPFHPGIRCLSEDGLLALCPGQNEGMMACSVIHPFCPFTSAVNESLPMNCLKMETLCRRGNSRFLLILVSQHSTTPRTHFHYHPVVGHGSAHQLLLLIPKRVNSGSQDQATDFQDSLFPVPV